MGIAPISGISTYGSIASVQPMNYAVENTADFSDAYNVDATKQTAGVNGASPVQYPNAKVSEVGEDATRLIDPIERQKRNLEVSNQFNDIASQFTMNKTSYNMSGVGASYSMAGSRFDAYA